MSVQGLISDVERELASPATRALVDSLSDEQWAAFARYWVDRAVGELTTALTFEFMRDDLTREGVPAVLLEMASAAIVDEHAHFECCARWAAYLAPWRGTQAALSGTRPLEFDGASAHDNRLLRTVFGCCFSETVAVHVLRDSHRAIVAPGIRRLNREHLKGEVQHARLGWALLGWPGLKARDRDMIRSYAPEMTRLVRAVWQSTRRPSDEQLHALGYLSSELVAAACDEALEAVIVPGFERLAAPH